MSSKIRSGPFCWQCCVVVSLFSFLIAAPAASEADDLEVFRIYEWSSFENSDSETRGNCRAIDKKKAERGWAVARREVADVSELEDPDDQKKGSTYRVFVDYCVHVDGSKERPVGAMRFRVAPVGNLSSVKRWGVRHYRTTSAASKRAPKPGREHFDAPRW